MSETTMNVVALPEPVIPADPVEGEKTPCEVCKKLVSTNPFARRQHMKTHGIKSDMKTGAIPPEQRPMPANLDADQASDVAYARAVAQRRRKEAPTVAKGIASLGSLMTQTVERLKAAGIIPAGMHSFFGDMSKHRSYLGKGYEPVYENGRQVYLENMYLYMIDEDIYQAHERAAENLSRRTLEQQINLSNQNSDNVGLDKKSRSSTKSQHTIDDVTEETANGSLDTGKSPLGG